MKKTTFHFKKILAMGALLIAGSASAQGLATVTTGTTHCTTVQDDCSTGAMVSTTFTITVGDLVSFTNGYFRVRNDLYQGDWTSQGISGHIVTNEVLYASQTSPSVTVTDITTFSFKTLSFFGSSTPTFLMNKNAVYRAKTILQQKISGVWTDVFTTPLSSAYGALDQPPFTPYGDMAELAFIENMKIGTNFNYSVNGLYQSGSTPLTVATCASAPLSLKNITGTMGNPGTATLTVEKGTLSGNAFTASSSTITTFGAEGNNDINLTSAPFSLSSYVGALRVTYKLPDDVCNSVVTAVAKTTTLSVVTAAFLNDYQAPTGSAVVSGCASSAQTKAVSPTPNILASMPSSTVLNTFKCQLKTAVGWQGATSAGIADLTYAGNYSIDVYEVNSSGVRLSGAPSLYLKSGSAASGDQVNFNDYGYAVSFNASNPPFYNDVAFPANASGAGDGYNYFHDFYEAARTNSVTVGNLTSFSARIFCAEVNQYPAGGCVVAKKSYFRIANNGLLSGSTVRLSTSTNEETEEQYPSLEVYPNPTNGSVIVPLDMDDKNVQIIVTDNLGKQVIKMDNLESNHGELNMSVLPAGIYFYNVLKNNTSYKGKIVKQ